MAGLKWDGITLNNKSEKQSQYHDQNSAKEVAFLP